MTHAAPRRFPHWLRIVIPALLIIGWVAVAGVGGPYFGKVSEVSSNDQSSYLPESAEATQVQELLPEFNDDDAIPAIAVFVADAQLSDEALEQINSALDTGENEASPAIGSDDGMAVQSFIALPNDDRTGERVDALEHDLQAAAPDGVSVYITGPAGFSADLLDAFAGIDGLLLGVALLAVLIILVLVYRSLLLPIVVLTTSMSALCAALLTVWWLAKWEILMLSGQTQGILFILVIGAATDYSLLLVARYREELRVHEESWPAARQAVKGTLEPVLASGSTVIAGLLCLLLSDLKSNSSLGPVASIGIVFAMLAALTLLPALLAVFGRAVFWPKRPHYEPETVEAEGGMPTASLWSRLAQRIPKHPRPIWLLTVLVLAGGTLGVAQLQATGVPQSDLVLGQSQARDGQTALGKHFPGGSGSPVYVVTAESNFDDVSNVLLEHSRIDDVTVTSNDSPSGSAPVTEEGITAYGPPGSETPEPTVVHGQLLLSGTLDVAADSDAAQTAVIELRDELSAQQLDALVGGVSATALDTNTASIHDRNLIIPIVLTVITLILMLLLRAILAPILLILTTVLSFGTAMGVSALMFNHVFDFPGADPAVPLYGFVFLVALGIDYNIFLMTRVREETLSHGTREGIVRGLSITGGVITSAGLVLAATFAALAVIPILFLVQLAFIVAFGVLLDTFVVRTLLVPALASDIGPAIWWPSKLSREPQPRQPRERNTSKSTRRVSTPETVTRR